MAEKVSICVIVTASMLILQGWAQVGPGAIEDAEIERQRLLKAADQLEVLTHKVETLQLDMTQLKQEIASLKKENTDLRKELAAMDARNTQKSEALIEEVGRIVAETGSAPTAQQAREGYEHVVESGQSLWAIANAFQKQGVKVSVDDIRKANNLKEGAILRVGQKLFIPGK